MTRAVTLDGMTIPVELGGSSRRARLTVERDGSLRLRAGADVECSELEAFVASKRKWIYEKLAEKELFRAEPITKELVDGEGFLYLGRSHQLRIVDEAAAVRLHRGRIVLPRRLADDGRAALIDWYQSRGTKWLRPRLTDWAHRLRVEPRTVETVDLGYKWGAATPDSRVRIHWATLQLQPDLIDYVMVHELAHLREPHHGPAFWLLINRVLPDYEDRRTRLAEVGSGLWFGSMEQSPRSRS